MDLLPKENVLLVTKEVQEKYRESICELRQQLDAILKMAHALRKDIEQLGG